jgi:hypothetical protein
MLTTSSRVRGAICRFCNRGHTIRLNHPRSIARGCTTMATAGSLSRRFCAERVSIEKANPSSVSRYGPLSSALQCGVDRSAPFAANPVHHDREATGVLVVTEPEPVKLPVSAPSPDPSPQPSPAERPIAAPSSATPARRATVAEAGSAPSARVARGRGEPLRPAAVPKAPRPAAEPGRVAASPVPPPAPEPSRAPVPPARPAAPPINRAAERWTPPPPSPPPSPIGDDLAIGPDDSGYAAPPRLSGLRNLLVSLGRKSLNKDGDSAAESDSDLEPRFERATLRPAYADTSLPDPDSPEGGDPVRLTARPEILPPKAVAEVEKEKESVRPTPPRRDNPDGEEIQTLPSWRGQYRKKRYPPI